MQPQVSIILPVYNGQAYLEQALRSLHAQTMGDFEVIVGEDGSTDASPAILARVVDPRLRLVGGDPNRGLFPNINRLLPHARAPLIRFFCQDDIIEPECLAEETAFMATHPTAAMSFCKAALIDESGTEVGRGALDDMPALIAPWLSLQLFYYYGCLPGNLSTVIVRREHLERVGPFNTTFHVAADYDLWARLCRHADLGVLHRHLVRLRVHARQLSRWERSGNQFVTENRRVMNDLLGLLPVSIQPHARRYAHQRQDVLAVHHALRCLVRGRPSGLVQTVRALGPHAFLLGAFFWLATVNNRLYRPRPHFWEGPAPVR